jgi:DNA ligase (NAD+)
MTFQEAEVKIVELTKKINEHNYNYYVLDNPQISDYEFDILLEELIGLEKEFPDLLLPDSPSQRVAVRLLKIFLQSNMQIQCFHYQTHTHRKNWMLLIIG